MLCTPQPCEKLLPDHWVCVAKIQLLNQPERTRMTSAPMPRHRARSAKMVTNGRQNERKWQACDGVGLDPCPILSGRLESTAVGDNPLARKPCVAQRIAKLKPRPSITRRKG